MGKIIINAQERKNAINRNIYGHFSEHLGRCIYGGLFVGENSAIPNVKGMRSDIVNALRYINVPVLRWPGGCFADEYHWKDGVGPKENRKRMVNTHWGGTVEDNSFGTHEFMELCAQIGCEPYINGNVGSGTVREMSEWVEYMTFGGVSPMTQLRAQNGRDEPWKLTYFGVGNENWGCGGNMRPEFYADVYRQYQTYVRNYGGNKIYKIACGANSFDYEWTDKVMGIAGQYMDAITLHYYTLPTGDWQDKGSADDFDCAMYYATIARAMQMEKLISGHLEIMNRHDPEHRVGLIVDEWGAWYNVQPGTNPGFLYQQNTMRDAVLAALTLNIFNAYSSRVVMANLAQTVNVLQSLILTEGPRMVLTPTYHVFDLYKAHQDAQLLGIWADGGDVGDNDNRMPAVTASASEKAGKITLTAANISAEKAMPINCRIFGADVENVSGRILTGAIQAKNDFNAPHNVKPEPFDDFTRQGEEVVFDMPPCSVMEVTFA